MTSSRFSIVITCFNQREFIRAAVDSALSQRYPRKEIIVVDDGSSDGSRELLEQYEDSIQLVKFPNNRGAIEARNQGAGRAKGDYLVFLDGDDLFMPWALDVYDRIVVDRNPKIIISPCSWFRGPIPPARAEDAPRSIEFAEYDAFMAKDRQCGLMASTLVVDRQAFLDVGGWTPGIFHMDVMDISTKLGYSGRTIIMSSPSTIFYRIHTGNSIHSVPPFIRKAHELLSKERAGKYAGGREHRFERYAWFGGMVVFWTNRALRAGLYKDALRLAVSGWPMISAAVLLRSLTYIRGRRPIETIDLTNV